MRTDIPCECGEYELTIINDGIVGYMGDQPCYQSYGKCPKCEKRIFDDEINKRFEVEGRGHRQP